MGTWIPDLLSLEKSIIQKLATEGEPLPLIIAIGGFCGTGKDTLSMKLMEQIDYDLGIKFLKYNAGDFIREIAVNEGFAPENLDRFVDKIKDSREYSDKIDLSVEKKTLQTALEKGGVFTGRMAPFTIGDNGFTVFLQANPEIIATRLTKDRRRNFYGHPVHEIVNKITRRDNADKKRLVRLYGIDFKDLLGKVNIVLDSSSYSIDESTQQIYRAFRQYYSHLDQK